MLLMTNFLIVRSCLDGKPAYWHFLPTASCTDKHLKRFVHILPKHVDYENDETFTFHVWIGVFVQMFI